VRIFPSEASCLRLIRALAAETHEDWLEASRYLNVELLKEHKKLRLPGSLMDRRPGPPPTSTLEPILGGPPRPNFDCEQDPYVQTNLQNLTYTTLILPKSVSTGIVDQTTFFT
jgi:hypothetical protein